MVALESMSLNDLTSRQAVLDALAEYDRLGETTFLEKYGFGRIYSYALIHEGRRYPSKAIAGAAHGFQFPQQGPLPASAFSGGNATVRVVLKRLDFAVDAPGIPAALRVGDTGSWDVLGGGFGFRSDLRPPNRIVPVRDDIAVLVTQPGSRNDVDLADYWDDADLVFTGDGSIGDQTLDGANADIASGRRRLAVFESVGTDRYSYLGEATCRRCWTARAPDAKGADRLVYRFQLAFGEPARAQRAPTRARPLLRGRQPRPFDPQRVRAPYEGNPEIRRSPEETLALQEQAVRKHEELLVTLHEQLRAWGWAEFGEIEGGFDLWARRPGDGRRVIFEAKTLRDGSESGQCRSGLAQLLEYRFFDGDAEDELCLAVDAPISDARLRFLEAQDIAVIEVSTAGVLALGPLAARRLGLT